MAADYFGQFSITRWINYYLLLVKTFWKQESFVFENCFKIKKFYYFFIFLYFFFAEISHPIQFLLISEEVPSISIILNERRSNSLKGFISSKKNILSNFYTHRPIRENSTSWSFENGQTKLNGEAILLKDGQICSYQTKIKSHEVNTVIFSGLSFKLSKITNNADLLKGAAGFFKIGNGCYGGRIKKV